MFSISHVLPLFLLLLLFLTLTPPTSATRALKYHRRKLRQARKEARTIQEKLYLLKRKCPRRRLRLYQKAARIQGCNFAPGNGLKAVRLIRKLCWKRQIHFRYRAACRKKSKPCKKALAFVKRAEWKQCERKIKRLAQKLNKVKEKIDSLVLLVSIKPSNAPRMVNQDCLAGDPARNNGNNRCWGS